MLLNKNENFSWDLSHFSNFYYFYSKKLTIIKFSFISWASSAAEYE